jgi:hypothetical protein
MRNTSDVHQICCCHRQPKKEVWTFTAVAAGQTTISLKAKGAGEHQKERIKNSWGDDWGEGGFGWIAYGSNRIGRHTAWIKANSNFYVIKHPIFMKKIPIAPTKPQPGSMKSEPGPAKQNASMKAAPNPR